MSLILQKKKKKKGPNAVIMTCSPKTQILLQTFITNICSYRIRTCWKLLGTLWFMISWTTLSGWYFHGYALKSAKIYFHSLKYFFIKSLNLIAKKKENPQSRFCLPKIKNKHTYTDAFLRQASHNSAFRILSLHSTKFKWCTLSAQLIARYQPNVRIFGRYLAHRLSTYPRTEITLFQTCLEYNLGYRKC